MTQFFELTEEDAREYLAFIQRREPARLADLVRWLEGTGGPIEAMNGTLESLVPLWRWFVDFVIDGCPTIDSDAISSRARALGTSSTKPQAPYVAAECVEHYVFRVIRNYYADARWDVLIDESPTKTDIFHFETGIRFGGDRWQQVAARLSVMVSCIPDNIRGVRGPERLKEVVQAAFSIPDTATPLAGVSAPLTSIDLLDAARFAELGPSFSASQSTQEDRPTVSDELVLAPVGMVLGRERDEDFLEVDALAHSLSVADFAGHDGRSPEKHDLTVDGGEFISRRAPITAQIRVTKGKVRAVLLAAHNAPLAEWASVKTELQLLGDSQNAKLVSQESLETLITSSLLRSESGESGRASENRGRFSEVVKPSQSSWHPRTLVNLGAPFKRSRLSLASMLWNAPHSRLDN